MQIDLDPRRIGLRYDVETGIVGDSRKTLRVCCRCSSATGTAASLTTAREGHEQMRERSWKSAAASADMPMKPQVVAWELGGRLTENAIVSSDSGTIATWFARQIKARARADVQPLRHPRHHGQRPALCHRRASRPIPDRQCVAFVGDGGFSMLMAEFATAVKYELPIKVIIIKNNSLGMIKWEQMVFLGNPEYECELQPIAFPGIRPGLRWRGIQRR